MRTKTAETPLKTLDDEWLDLCCESVFNEEHYFPWIDDLRERGKMEEAEFVEAVYKSGGRFRKFKWAGTGSVAYDFVIPLGKACSFGSDSFHRLFTHVLEVFSTSAVFLDKVDYLYPRNKNKVGADSFNPEEIEYARLHNIDLP